MRIKRVFDIESYQNYFLVSFKELGNDTVQSFEIREEDESLSKDDQDSIREIVKKSTLIGYNCTSYDNPMLAYALKGKSAYMINSLSKFIIDENLNIFKTSRMFGVNKPDKSDIIDIRNSSSWIASDKFASLKGHGVRLHGISIQDLPIDPHSELTESEMDTILEYCSNDLDLTELVYNHLKEEVGLKIRLGELYSHDFRSMARPAIAEYVMRKRLGIFTKANVPKPENVKYVSPDCVEFKTSDMNDFKKMIESIDFQFKKRVEIVRGKKVFKSAGEIAVPKQLKDSYVTICETTYDVGVGGLHSREKSMDYISSDEYVYIRSDVVSYYPNMMLNFNIYPKHIGERFVEVLREIVEQRIKAKNDGIVRDSNSLKVLINSIFGKMGNEYSSFYDPNAMLRVTMTGQLLLLQLIEMLEDEYFFVVSANTDGIVARVLREYEDDYYEVLKKWESVTGLTLESKPLKALYARDCNCYLEIHEDDSYVGKGIFKPIGVDKAPEAEICCDAVVGYLTHKKPLDETIRGCTDIRKFILSRKVKSGGLWRGELLGKTVRWVWTTDGEVITESKMRARGKKLCNVGKSEGAMPVMRLGKVPSTLDYGKYVEHAEKILRSVGINGLSMEVK